MFGNDFQHIFEYSFYDAIFYPIVWLEINIFLVIGNERNTIEVISFFGCFQYFIYVK